MLRKLHFSAILSILFIPRASADCSGDTGGATAFVVLLFPPSFAWITAAVPLAGFDDYSYASSYAGGAAYGVAAGALTALATQCSNATLAAVPIGILLGNYLGHKYKNFSNLHFGLENHLNDQYYYTQVFYEF